MTADHDAIAWPGGASPADQAELIAGCTCPGRAEGRHDMCCEWVLRAAGLTDDTEPDWL